LWLPVEHSIEYLLAHMPMDGDADQQLGVGVDVGDFVLLSRHTLTRSDGPVLRVCLEPNLAQGLGRLAWSGDFVRFSRAFSVLEVRVWV
jgi:hypothetical protein